MKKESNLWNWLRKAKHSTLDMQRIENICGGGTPDVEGILLGVQFWIELKFVERPKRKTTLLRPKFQPKQVPWLEKRWRLGGKAYCLLQVGKGFKARRYLVKGEYAGELEKGILEKSISKISITDGSEKSLKILKMAIKNPLRQNSKRANLDILN